MKKRGLSIVLVLAMVFSLIMVPQTMGASAAEFYDTKGLDCELAVDVVSALGIMSGYTDGSFLPYNTLTKAETAAIAVALAGVEDYPAVASEEDVQFNDMYGYDGWASGVVSIARSMGIALGDDDGNFNPDMSATYEDALQMVVCALGYGYVGATTNDYMTTARKLGLTKKLSTGIGQNITRADVAKLVYEALTADLMQQVSYSADGYLVKFEGVEGQNALNTYFDVNEIKGVVYENEYTGLDGETSVGERKVNINDESFDIGSTNIADYLGYYVTAYALDAADATEDRVIIAFSVQSVKNNTMTIEDENIAGVEYSVTGYTFSYWVDKNADKKAKTVKTSSTPMVLYNGKAITSVTTDVLMPKTGHVVLIDNNGDDKYDIIDVWEYTLVYAAVATSSGNVTSYYDMTKTYKLDVENENYHITVFNSNGGAANVSDIDQYSVLYVYESLDGKDIKVVLSNNSINGEVTEIDGDTYIINNVGYDMSPGAKGHMELSVMDSGDFYLDADGRIAGFEGSTVIRRQIGMMIAIDDGGLSRGYQMKVLTQNSGVKVYNIASSVKVNGTNMTASQIYEYAFTNLLFGATEDPVYQGAGIKRPHPSRAGFLYRTNSADEITEMIVVGEDSYLQTRQLKTAGYLYYSNAKHVLHYSGETTRDEYGNTVGKRTYASETTMNFICDEALINANDNNNFWTTRVRDYWDNYNFDTYDYIWAYYYSSDESEINMQRTAADFLVMADWYDNSGDSGNDTSQNIDARYYQDNTAVKFIYKVTKAVDKSGESMEDTFRVYYFDGTSLKNNLVRPQYKSVAYLDETAGTLYPNGFPVRISFDGSYIEDVAPFFSDPHTTILSMITPAYNPSTSKMIKPWRPFYQSQWKKWNQDASNSYESRYYLGMITAVDEIVGNDFFDVAYSNVATPLSTNDITIKTGERLEGTVYTVNYTHDGDMESIKKGTTDDIAPGQLVLIRTRGYDTSPKWEALTGYSVNEIIILDDSVTELDYLKDFYTYAMQKVNESIK